MDTEAMIRVDDTRWPIVRIVFAETVSLDDVAYIKTRIEEVHRVRGPVVLLSDTTALQASEVTPLHRKALAEAADDLAGKGALLAEAVIVPSALIRVMYTGYTWLRKRADYPARAFPDAMTAFYWAREQAHVQVGAVRSR